MLPRTGVKLAVCLRLKFSCRVSLRHGVGFLLLLKKTDKKVKQVWILVENNEPQGNIWENFKDFLKVQFTNEGQKPV